MASRSRAVSRGFCSRILGAGADSSPTHRPAPNNPRNLLASGAEGTTMGLEGRVGPCGDLGMGWRIDQWAGPGLVALAAGAACAQAVQDGCFGGTGAASQSGGTPP